VKRDRRETSAGAEILADRSGVFVSPQTLTAAEKKDSTADTEYRPQFDLCAKGKDKKCSTRRHFWSVPGLTGYPMAQKVAAAEPVAAAELTS
jgi:hypothetical protein